MNEKNGDSRNELRSISPRYQKRANLFIECGKKLNCFYQISLLLRKSNNLLDKVVQGIVDIIPHAYQYPEITCVRIIFKDKEFRTKCFKETKWKQSCDIVSNSKPWGKLQVYYLKERLESDGCPFLKEEKRFLNAIADLIAYIIRHERKEEKLKQQAFIANLSRSDFLANISHEIRTPMHGILGMTALALGTDLTSEQREYLDTIKKSANYLMAIINDILDYSKIEAEKIELVPIEFSLRDCIENSVDSLAIQAHGKGLELACYIPPEIPETIIGDPGRLRQIIINLVSNSIKFTEKGEIIVSVEEKSRTEKDIYLHFTVADTGVGIPKSKQRMIFDSFSQVDSSISRRFDGTGLGLAISSQLVELMRGRIWVESKVRQGSIFHFTANFGLQKRLKEKPIPAIIADLKSLSVLIVDDNATNRRILKRMLIKWRMKPTDVSTGKEALAAIRRAKNKGKSFDLILIDSFMPEIDGFTLASKIKQNKKLTKPIVMMLTSAGRRGDAARCQKLGISAYLLKPIKASELLEAIFLALGTSSKQRKSLNLITRHSIRESLPPMDILLAEDNIINQKVTIFMLKKHGHKVTVALDGREVLKALENKKFDLILMDVQMPNMDGFQAATSIREKEEKTGSHIPIVAMTAHAMKGDQQRCLKAGMDDYLAKPLDPEELYKVINKVFIKQKMNRKELKKSQMIEEYR